MKITQVMDVVQCSRYEVDGSRGASVFVLEANDGTNPNLAGNQLIKLPAEYDLFDQIKDHLPAKLECTVSMAQAGGNKGKLVVLAAKPLKAAS